jgi:hypothetical protein
VLHLANQGVTINQIHNVYELPKGLQQRWHCRGYHGSPEHNARGVIQRFLGFWDGNPATLIPLSPEDSAALYVEMMGGGQDPGPRRELYDQGKYLLAQEIVNKLVQPNRRTRRPRICWPTSSSRSATSRRTRACATASWPPPTNCARASPRAPRELQQPRRDPRDVHRAVPELPRHPDGQPQGRGPAFTINLITPGQWREVHRRAGQRHADQHPGVPREAPT